VIIVQMPGQTWCFPFVSTKNVSNSTEDDLSHLDDKSLFPFSLPGKEGM
jgi:hypothetical protein